MNKLLLLINALFAVQSFAQTNDDWSSFPSRATETRRQQDDEPEPSKDPRVTIQQRELYVRGSEPHSMATWQNSLDDQSNGRVTVGHVGVGILHLPTARLGPKGIVRVSLLGEYFNATQFPVQSARNIRSAVTFAASFVPFSWAEIFLSYGAASNSNNRTSPNLIQTMGELTLGFKASREWTAGIFAGIDVRAFSFPGVGSQGVDRFAWGVRPSFVGTADFRAFSRRLPLILTVNAGVTLDSTQNLIQNETLNASEEFAYNVNRYHRLNVGAALEFAIPVIAPFVEYRFAPPLGVEGGQLVGPSGLSVSALAAANQAIGVGFKVTAIRDLTLIAAADFGLTRSVGLGITATPPWNVLVGASFAVDPFARPQAKIVEKIVEHRVEAPVPIRLQGVVVDADTNDRLSDVIISGAGAYAVASDQSGRFMTHEVSGPRVQVTATREGFHETHQTVLLDAAKPTSLTIELKKKAPKTQFKLSATSSGRPIKATIQISAAGNQPGDWPITLELTPEAASIARELPAGNYVVTAVGEGYLSQVKSIQVGSVGTTEVAFDLAPAPKKMLANLKGNKIEISQQVRFATGSAEILPVSHGLLTQVVDIILRKNIRRLRVEGHTDNRGNKPVNLKLSTDRAEAVANFLTAQGIDRERLTALGFGDSRPVAPNLTARGRELNRRVEFVVVENE